jgi:membrane protein YdbS with pleckstrin-like domain
MSSDLRTIDPSSMLAHAPPSPVIFQGSPSQVICVPFYFGCCLAIVLTLWLFNWAMLSWSISYSEAMTYRLWALPLIVCSGIGLSMFSRYLKLATTVYTIDHARITTQHGIGRKVIAGVELYRIQSVQVIEPWWPSLFGTGTLILKTSNRFHPTLALIGMRNAEQLRAALIEASLELRQQLGMRVVTVGPT